MTAGTRRGARATPTACPVDPPRRGHRARTRLRRRRETPRPHPPATLTGRRPPRPRPPHRGRGPQPEPPVPPPACRHRWAGYQTASPVWRGKPSGTSATPVEANVNRNEGRCRPGPLGRGANVTEGVDRVATPTSERDWEEGSGTRGRGGSHAKASGDPSHEADIGEEIESQLGSHPQSLP